MPLFDQFGGPLNGVNVCRGCGCDDNHACVHPKLGPCRWVLLDTNTQTGVCSSCAERMHWHPIGMAMVNKPDAPLPLGLERYADDLERAA